MAKPRNYISQESLSNFKQDKEYYSTAKFAQLLGVSKGTLFNWNKSGKLKPALITPGGYFRYSYKQLLSMQSENVDESE